MFNGADVSTVFRALDGKVPPKRTGATLTVVGTKVYLFGGVLLRTSAVVNDLFVFDFTTSLWSEVKAPPGSITPRPRCFHTSDLWRDYLVVFGGRTLHETQTQPVNLNDVQLFDLGCNQWVPVAPSHTSSRPNIVPQPRHAHISCVTGNFLYIFGGQSTSNEWLDNISVYNLRSRKWIAQHSFGSHCGRYRSTAVSSSLYVRIHGSDKDEYDNPTSPSKSSSSSSSAGHAKFIHLPYSARNDEDQPWNVYLYSNAQGPDSRVMRNFKTLLPVPTDDGEFTVDDDTGLMTGSLPPPLRFPTANIVGSHFLLSGIGGNSDSFQFVVYSMDTRTRRWTRVPLDSAMFCQGSWFGGCYWAQGNKLVVFGDKQGSIREDHAQRPMSFDHAAFIDLEVFGIYQPPEQQLDMHMQEMGLAALKGQHMTDFELICDDDRTIACSRKVLEDRWPWLKSRLQNVRLDPLFSDPRLTLHSFKLNEPYTTTLALLQYFYAMAFITPLQHMPPVLNQLLVIASSYNIPHLAQLTLHAMHCDLTSSNAASIGEVASMCGCRSLQMRALALSMSNPPSQNNNNTASIITTQTLVEDMGRVSLEQRRNGDKVTYEASKMPLKVMERDWIQPLDDMQTPDPLYEQNVKECLSSNGTTYLGQAPPTPSSSDGGSSRRISEWLLSSNKSGTGKKAAKLEEKRKKKEEEKSRLAALTERLRSPEPRAGGGRRSAPAEGTRKAATPVMYGGFGLVM